MDTTSVTIRLDGSRGARVSDQRFETRPPDRIEFVAEGVVRVTEGLLSEFAGSTLQPARVGLSVDDSRTVTVDLTEEASLRLEAVDVGVETPDAEDVSSGLDSLNPTTDEAPEPPDQAPGAIAFTTEGAILHVPEETLDALSGRSPTLEWITFEVDDPLETDGGADSDVLLEVTLLGYGVVVRRNGVVEIGAR